MLNPPDAQFCSTAQIQTAAQSGNVVFDYSCGSLETEGYRLIRLCLADEKQNLRFPWCELDESNHAVWWCGYQDCVFH
jgi:hypothetical protein